MSGARASFAALAGLVVLVALAAQLVADGLYGTLAVLPSVPRALAGDWPFALAERTGLDRIPAVRVALARGAIVRDEPARAVALLAPLGTGGDVIDLRGRAAMLANDPAGALRDFTAAGDFIAAEGAIDALGDRDPRAALALVRDFEARLVANGEAPEITAEVEWREGGIAAAAARRYPAQAAAYDRASVDAFARALARAPNDEKYLLNYAFAALRNGDVEVAKRTYAARDGSRARQRRCVSRRGGDGGRPRSVRGLARGAGASARLCGRPASHGRDARYGLCARRARGVRALQRVRVALDAQLAVGTATGIGTYQRDLARALAAAGIDVRTLQFPALDPWRFDRRVVWDQLLLPWLAARSGAGVLHAASGTLPLVRTLPVVVTVHDMAWLRVQAHTRAYARAYFGGLMKRLYRGAAAIMTDSAFARDEFLELAGPRENVQVVYPGVDERFAALARRPRARPFALVAGTVERRKNLLRAVETLAAVPELDLVAVGPPTPYLDEVRARVAALASGRARRGARLRRARRARRALRRSRAGAGALALRRLRLRGGRGAVRGFAGHRRAFVVAGRGRGRRCAADRSRRRGRLGRRGARAARRPRRAERRAAAARAAAVERFAWSRAAAAVRRALSHVA